MFQSTEIYDIYNIYDDDQQNLVPSMFQSTEIYDRKKNGFAKCRTVPKFAAVSGLIALQECLGDRT
jgi:hypothetical protein